MGKKMEDIIGMPLPDHSIINKTGYKLLCDELSYDIEDMERKKNELQAGPNEKQEKNIRRHT